MRAQLIHNSAFPVGENDGAVWAGRGLTAVVEAGLDWTRGPVTVTLAPLAFATQNQDFRTAPTGLTGNRSFADWRNPNEIDLPQRFGDSPYGAVDPGESGVRVDMRRVAIGISTAHHWWGPAIDHPIILGNNAAGFAHVFVESAQPFSIWRLGRVHGRVFWGRPTQTRYSPLADSGESRLASGLVAVFQPGALQGLELGAGRFFHVRQRRFGFNVGEFTRPFGGFFETTSGQDAEANQLASMFFRLVLPADGVEVYGEYGREDRNYDLRELWLIPDHDAAYMLGFRKAWRRAGSVSSLRAEVLNSRVSHLAIVSNQAPWYVHSSVLQGHTNNGQVLGSAAAYGGGASVIAFDRYSGRGRLTFRWERLQLAESRLEQAPDLFQNDVAHIWSANVLRFGPKLDTELGLGIIHEFNRNLGSRATSLRSSITVARSPRSRSTK